MSNQAPISTSSDWTFELIETYDQEISEVAESFMLETYPNQIEIISAEQMLDAYASVGMPLGYQHWSFGKQFMNIARVYKRGQMNLAYEIVINSNPCITYCMEENTMAMQALVIAHACYGHNSFFYGNYLFRTWTDASSIIDYLLFAKNYIFECEVQYGVKEVEDLLDSCHALMNYGVDRYKRSTPMSAEEEMKHQKEREEYLQRQINELWRTIPTSPDAEKEDEDQDRFPSEPQENILYFIEKNAPFLEPWQREVVRIVRKIAQYFYPQRQTQVMNEGWATFWHYTLLNELYNRDKVTDGFIMEFLHSHTSVIYQPPFDSQNYNGINPYALGFSMMQDIKRICENPTDEDKKWFPYMAGTNWLDTLKFAMKNFKDESFILQFLSPKTIRDLKLFCILDDETKKELEIAAIHDENGYQYVREVLASQYNLSYREPNIQVHNADVRGDRSLTLHHIQHDGIPLAETTEEVLKHIHRLWGFDIHIESWRDSTLQNIYHCPNEEPEAKTLD